MADPDRSDFNTDRWGRNAARLVPPQADDQPLDGPAGAMLPGVKQHLPALVLRIDGFRPPLCLATPNDNRVAQYGDDYIDQDVMDWAKQVGRR